MIDSEQIDPAAIRRKLLLKRCFDRVLALGLLLVLWPVILAVALLIRLEGLRRPALAGPAFHGETRVSAGRQFRIWKFRTVPMPVVAWIRERPEVRSISKAKKYRTPMGKLILNWYLDELPQLWNILKGEMSFVGPRPQPTQFYERQLTAGLYALKYLRGGLLGIPQACKGNAAYVAYFREMARDCTDRTGYPECMDELYLHKVLHSSALGVLFFDLTILARGIRTVLVGGGGSVDAVIGKPGTPDSH
jgi:lipopolysaccharide/colanic/teichoic acid biosynthesis glycosyltransferase